MPMVSEKMRLSGRWLWVLLIFSSFAALNTFKPLETALNDDFGGAARMSDAKPEIAGDFYVFWIAQKIAASSPAQIYNLKFVSSTEDRLASNPDIQLPWLYPPPTLLLTYMIPRAGYFVSLAFWNFSLIIISVALLRFAGFKWIAIGVSCISPAALVNLSLGQIGLLTGSMLVLALAKAKQKNPISSMMFGLLIMKPQLALLAPIVLFRTRGLQALLASGLTVVMIIIACSWIFGDSIWPAYFSYGLSSTHMVLVRLIPSGGISVYWMARSLDCSVASSFFFQALSIMIVATLCWHIWRLPEVNPHKLVLLTLYLSFLATPYGYTYDLFGSSILIAAMALQEKSLTLTDLIMWIWPIIGVFLGAVAHLQLTPVLVSCAAFHTYKDLRQTSSAIRR